MIQEATRVIFLPFIDAFGGSERLVLDLCRFLDEKSIRHELVCFSQTIDLQNYSSKPLTVRTLLPKRNPLVEARALSAFLRDASASRYCAPLLFDLKSAFYSGLFSSGSFFLHLTDPPSLLPADLSKYSNTARKRYKPFAEEDRAELVQRLRGDLVHRLTARGVRRASKTIVMTERIRSELRDLYDVDAEVVRPGVLPREGRSLRTPTDQIRLLSVSRLEANKRIDWILRALASLESDTRLPWVFEIVGQGPERESLGKLANDLGLMNRVVFRGHVSEQELEEAYAKASVFLMPAVQGYGLPALEALQRGVPAVIHRDSGVSEILGGSPWVEIVDGSNGELRSAIGAMLNRVGDGPLNSSTLPSVPASDEWAEQISTICGWL